MKHVLHGISLLQAVTAVLFALFGIVLMATAGWQGIQAVAHGLDERSGQPVIEAVGLLAAAVVAVQNAQTILEEEVVRDVNVSAPTRVRRFLSRFPVVVVVALAIEGVVATFKAFHENMEHLLHAGALIASTAALLAGWGTVRTREPPGGGTGAGDDAGSQGGGHQAWAGKRDRNQRLACRIPEHFSARASRVCPATKVAPLNLTILLRAGKLRRPRRRHR